MPIGELRRKDREMSAAESEELLGRALVGRLGTVSPDGMPYVVPMSFAYDSARRAIFLHGATEGHRLDNLAYSPLACFEVDEPGELIPTGDEACGTSQVYKSVICFGRASVVEDGSEKEDALRHIVRKYVDQLTPGRWYDPEMRTIDSTAAIVFQIERMTGKQRRPG